MAKAQVINAPALFAPWQNQLEVASQILVGFSGGLDSTVLLKLLCDAVPIERLCAVHVNHGLSDNADQWQGHAEAFCGSLGVKLHCETVAVSAGSEGVEAAAREARYRVFERLLDKGQLLLLGHHADDQVETVLYRLLRGSGVKGLSGIPITRSIAKGQLIRPLLAWQKSALRTYADQHKLSWIEDESNGENTFDRNYLRNQVIPEIAARWPDHTQRIGHSARLSQETAELLAALAEEDLQRLDPALERGGWSLSLVAFAALPVARQKNILRQWPGVHGLPLPGHKIIDEIMSALVLAREDASPKVQCQGMQWARFRNRLYLLRLEAPFNADNSQLIWQLDQPMLLADGSRLVAEKALGQGLCLKSNQSLRVGTRHGGERCQPAGRQHSNSLKKLLQEFNLEPWWRDRIPLLYRGETIVAVGDLWICEGHQAQSDHEGVTFHWQLNSLRNLHRS